MTVSPSVEVERKTPFWKKLGRVPWTWRITIGYLTVMLFIPIIAMFLKASTETPA
ncbi:MAG: sulfate ABC transporter permease subunit CysT, partial [Nostoc sp.]